MLSNASRFLKWICILLLILQIILAYAPHETLASPVPRKRMHTPQQAHSVPIVTNGTATVDGQVQKKQEMSHGTKKKSIGAKIKAAFVTFGKKIKENGLKIVATVVKFGAKVLSKILPIPGLSQIISYAGGLASAAIENAKKGKEAIKAAVKKAATGVKNFLF